MKISPEILQRIEKLTATDMKHKTIYELFASTAEEYGELARELKIKEKTFGNTYKKSDEGVQGESIDLFICAICMYYANQEVGVVFSADNAKKTFNILCLPKFDNVFKLFERMALFLAECVEDNCFALKLASSSMAIYFSQPGATEKHFNEYCNLKLDKWEKHQN